MNQNRPQLHRRDFLRGALLTGIALPLAGTLASCAASGAAPAASSGELASAPRAFPRRPRRDPAGSGEIRHGSDIPELPRELRPPSPSTPLRREPRPSSKSVPRNPRSIFAR